MLSWFLMKANQKVLVIDKLNPSSASNIASGISNPITGQRFVKSWMTDELLPFAENTYREFENKFGDKFFHPVSIVKLFNSVKAQNDWSARCASEGYLPYLKNEKLIYLNTQKVKNDFGGFEINGGSKLETEKFLRHFRNFLKNENALLEEELSFNDLKVENQFITYKDTQTRRIIFCDGANAIQNPYFKFLPFQLAKGECLIVRIEKFYTDKVINGEVFVMSLQDNHHYIGATHEWDFENALPSEKGKNELMEGLKSILNVPFEVLEHKAAIRPTVKDRRPFIGFHPEHSNIGIFNGMGTKGISLAPYFANHFVNHILKNEKLLHEVDIKRFFPKLVV